MANTLDEKGRKKKLGKIEKEAERQGIVNKEERGEEMEVEEEASSQIYEWNPT